MTKAKKKSTTKKSSTTVKEALSKAAAIDQKTKAAADQAAKVAKTGDTSKIKKIVNDLHKQKKQIADKIIKATNEGSKKLNQHQPVKKVAAEVADKIEKTVSRSNTTTSVVGVTSHLKKPEPKKKGKPINSTKAKMPSTTQVAGLFASETNNVPVLSTASRSSSTSVAKTVAFASPKKSSPPAGKVSMASVAEGLAYQQQNPGISPHFPAFKTR